MSEDGDDDIGPRWLCGCVMQPDQIECAAHALAVDLTDEDIEAGLRITHPVSVLKYHRRAYPFEEWRRALMALKAERVRYVLLGGVVKALRRERDALIGRLHAAKGGGDAALIVAWMLEGIEKFGDQGTPTNRMTPRDQLLANRVITTQVIRLVADAIERGDWRLPP